MNRHIPQAALAPCTLAFVVLPLVFAAAPAAAQPATPSPGEPSRQRPDAPAFTLQPVEIRTPRASSIAPDSESASRTDTPLIELPQSVQVITRSLIDEQASRTLGDALANVSGVRATKPEEALFVPPIVRGFPSEIYLNGLPTLGTAASNDPTSLVGIERVEVLKGPTSALYGGGVGAPWAG